MTPIVDLARIYALQNQIKAVNTHNRLHQLFQKGQFEEVEYQELLEAYQFLMRLRLENQIRCISQNKPPNNFIDPKQISLMDQRILKEALAVVKKYQLRIKLRFIPYE